MYQFNMLFNNLFGAEYLYTFVKKKIYFNWTKLGYDSYTQIYRIYFLLDTYILVLQ